MCLTLLETSGQDLPIQPHIGLKSGRGLSNPRLIDRVNKLMTYNIRSIYNCHALLVSSEQVNLSKYRVIINIWGYFDFAPKCRVKNLLSVSRELYT